MQTVFTAESIAEVQRLAEGGASYAEVALRVGIPVDALRYKNTQRIREGLTPLFEQNEKKRLASLAIQNKIAKPIAKDLDTVRESDKTRSYWHSVGLEF
jgi:transposase-like protein